MDKQYPRLAQVLHDIEKVQRNLSEMNEDLIFDINHELRAIHARIQGLINISEQLSKIEFILYIDKVNAELGTVISKLKLNYGIK